MKSEKLYGLHVITDNVLRPDRSHLDVAKAALAGGASVIQFRDKTMDPAEIKKQAGEILQLCRTAGVLLVIDDKISIAMEIGCDGVHLGQSDMPCNEARNLMGPDKVIGISVGNEEEAIRAERDGADYVGVGPIYTTGSKADAPDACGLDQIARIRKVCSLPIVAIGGINTSNIAEVGAAGAEAVAVISAVTCAEDMVQATHSLVTNFQTGRLSGKH